MTKPKRWLLRIGLVGLALLILIILSLALVPYEAQAKTATVTAYSELDSCHYPGCPMASGKKAYIGAVACPRHIKLGTTVIISGLPFTCEDRTAKRYDGRYDIFMGYGKQAHTNAIIFGKRTLTIEYGLSL